jgi:hypothetical protein
MTPQVTILLFSSKPIGGTYCAYVKSFFMNRLCLHGKNIWPVIHRVISVVSLLLVIFCPHFVANFIHLSEFLLCSLSLNKANVFQLLRCWYEEINTDLLIIINITEIIIKYIKTRYEYIFISWYNKNWMKFIITSNYY